MGALLAFVYIGCLGVAATAALSTSSAAALAGGLLATFLALAWTTK